jgi:hypothetical protein
MGGNFAKEDWPAFAISFVPVLIELAFALRWTAPKVVTRWKVWSKVSSPWWGFTAPIGAYMWIFMYMLGGAAVFLWWRNAEAVVGYGGYAAVLGLYFATFVVSFLWQGPFLYGPTWWPFALFITTLTFAGSLGATIVIGINAANNTGVPVLWASFALTLAFAFFMFITLITLTYMTWYRYRALEEEERMWGTTTKFWGDVTKGISPVPLPPPEGLEGIDTQFSTRGGVLINRGRSVMGQALRPRPGVRRMN